MNITLSRAAFPHTWQLFTGTLPFVPNAPRVFPDLVGDMSSKPTCA